MNTIRIPTVYTGQGGYPKQREDADELFVKGDTYYIVGGEVLSSMTYVNIEGFGDRMFNSVLFDVDHDILFKELGRGGFGYK